MRPYASEKDQWNKIMQSYSSLFPDTFDVFGDDKEEFYLFKQFEKNDNFSYTAVLSHISWQCYQMSMNLMRHEYYACFFGFKEIVYVFWS